MPLIKDSKEEAGYNSAQSRIDAILATSTVSATQGRKRFYGTNQRETLDDLEAELGTGSQFDKDAQLVLEKLGTSDDIFESLRDADYNIVRGIGRVMDLNGWSEEEKGAYARVLSRFDGADTGSFNQWIEAAKDISIDVVSDPTTILAFLAAPFTGGASTAGRAAVGQAVSKGVKQYASNTIMGAAAGASWGSVEDFVRQKTEQAVGLRDDISMVQNLAGAAVAGTLGGFMGRLVDKNAVERAYRVLDETPVQQEGRSLLRQRALAKTISRTIGKPSTYLDAYTDVSPTARELQKKLRYDQGKKWSNPLGELELKEVLGEDFFAISSRIGGKFMTDFEAIVEPLTFNRSGTRMTSDINDALIKAIRTGDAEDPTIKETAGKIRSMLDDIKQQLVDRNLISEESDIQNYFPRIWNRKAVEKGRDKLQRILLEAGEAEDMNEAIRIVDSLLDKKNQTSTMSNHTFSVARQFNRIKDDSVLDEFLDNDVLVVMRDYLQQTSKKIATVDTFGVRNLSEFQDKWLNPIVQEAKEKGKTLTRSEREYINNLYRYTTGEGLDFFDGVIGAAKDWTSFFYQASMLPMATISSLTEAILPLTRVDTPTYLKGFVQGANAGFKRLTVDILDSLQVKHNMTRPQVFREMNKFMIALDQATSDSVERLAGEALRDRGARKWQNRFFKLNLLTPWTHMVESMSFIMGKDLIRDNLNSIYKAKNRSNSVIIRKINELSELGIDYKKGLQWIKDGADEAADFYQNDLLGGAARFTREHILPTGRDASTRPLLQTHPKADILFQFMGYATAFSNVVLPNMAKVVYERPLVGGAKVFMAGFLMTEMARVLNFWRSDGKSEEDRTPNEARLEAIARWGGNGQFLEMMKRSKELVEQTGNNAMAPFGFLGPLPGEIPQAIAYNRGIVGILGTKVPGYGAGRAILGGEAMDDYNTWLRQQDKKINEIFDSKKGGERVGFAKGGLVQVPNAPVSPEKRRDKMTGLPYDIQAGGAFIDKEDPTRQGYALGGLIGKGVKKLGQNVVDASEVFMTKAAKHQEDVAEKRASELSQRLDYGTKEVPTLQNYEERVQSFIRGQLNDKPELSSFINEYFKARSTDEYGPKDVKELFHRDELSDLLAWFEDEESLGYILEQIKEKTGSELSVDRDKILSQLQSLVENLEGMESRQGFAAGGLVAKMVGITDEDLEWAKKVGKKYPGELDGEGDAARHVALGWLAARSKHPKIAGALIQLREVPDRIGGQMDQKNNLVGMRLEAETKEEAEAKIEELIRSGGVTKMSEYESKTRRGYAEGGEVLKVSSKSKVVNCLRNKVLR